MPARPKRRGALIRTSTALEVFRRMEKPAILGAIDWLLTGNRQNPYSPETVKGRAYDRGFDEERRATPRPGKLRLPWKIT